MATVLKNIVLKRRDTHVVSATKKLVMLNGKMIATVGVLKCVVVRMEIIFTHAHHAPVLLTEHISNKKMTDFYMIKKSKINLLIKRLIPKQK